MTSIRIEKVYWTIADLEGLPDNSNRYEIIDGDLFVTRAPHLDHQDIAGNIYAELRNWSRKKRLGKAFMTPGIIFSETDAVIPDVIWISYEKLNKFTDESGHITVAPELIIEVLSTSEKDIKRDCQTKLKLYSIHGVCEYWIIDRKQQLIEVYRRDQGILKKVMTLYHADKLTSLLLPNFCCNIEEIFKD
ncbi:MAG: Uma2 family endonuclease [Crocosphaera sp.]|nr:Uma2 family endonuclease [Crocosphaera sp.]